MSFIPDDTFRVKEGINFAPMIDFLFLMLMFFACIAVSRATSKDTEIDLVEVKPETEASNIIAEANHKIISISVNENGEYKWINEFKDYSMTNADEIALELGQQYDEGLLPKNKDQTKIMLKIDKNAKWEPILKAIFAIRDAGFAVHPVYEPVATNNL
jgi:biopolymer transport protein ExbD